MGPGLITAAANNDAGGITTYSVAGARFGYDLLWVLVILTVLLAVTQEMGARMAAVTGKGLADLIREEYGLRAVVVALGTLLVANFGVTSAEFAGVAAGFGIFGVPKFLSVPLVGLSVWLIVSSGSFRRVERIFMVFVLFYAGYVISGVIADPPWKDVLARLVVPTWNPDPDYVLLMVALTGTTVTPWGQFFIQSYVRDKGVTISDYKFTRFDVLSGSVFSNTISFFIMLATAATLFVVGASIDSAADAARALGPLAGENAQTLFGIGLIGASTLAASILPLSTAYVICEAFGWESGVGKQWAQAPHFNAIFTGTIIVGATVVLVPGIHLVTLQVLAETLGGVLLPVILFFTVKLASDRNLMGSYANSPIYSGFTWVCAVAIIALSVVLILRPLFF
jgi:NRAMP (natural resistance-associated macrophage protein)-like metal ion transporter